MGSEGGMAVKMHGDRMRYVCVCRYRSSATISEALANGAKHNDLVEDYLQVRGPAACGSPVCSSKPVAQEYLVVMHGSDDVGDEDIKPADAAHASASTPADQTSDQTQGCSEYDSLDKSEW